AMVIKAINGGDRKFCKKAKSSFPSIWLDIVHGVKLFKDRGRLARGIAFKSLHPRLYALELSKNIAAASKTTHCNLGYSLRRDPRGGVEQTQFDLMLERVEGTLLADMRDRWVWSLEGSGEFFVASVRKLIDDNMLLEVASD
ncbi:hypothetical protein Tco_0034950, partial [Tanacetum coccineum]